MTKIFFIILLVFVPAIAYGSVASDFVVNNQSTYAVPPGTTKVLILDLTLPDSKLTSIKINNAGTVQQYNVSKIAVWEDGSSPGWDGDESERIRKSSSPFFDTELTGDFSKQRIFVTIDISSTTYSGKTIKPEIGVNSVLFSDSAFNGPSDTKVNGFERIVLAGTSIPTRPISPLARAPEALSASSIRWHFIDLSNNELGFKILDGNLKEVARNETADISYVDETGLAPNTEYSGRQVIAFNDQGESLGSSLAIFSAVSTLAQEVVEEEVVEEEVEEEVVVEEIVEEEPSLLETIQTKIAEIQQKINELLKQLNELLQQQAATIRTAFQRFLQLFSGK